MREGTTASVTSLVLVVLNLDRLNFPAYLYLGLVLLRSFLTMDGNLAEAQVLSLVPLATILFAVEF